MSKLANILQPRTLPSPPLQTLFSYCIPKIPAMLTMPPRFSTAVSSDHSIEHSPINLSAVETTVQDNTYQTQTVAVKDTPAPDEFQNNADDSPWISRLAAEWQVGIDALVPLSQSEILLKQLAKSFDNSKSFDTTKLGDTNNDTNRVDLSSPIQLGFEPCLPLPTVHDASYKSAASTAFLSEKLLEAVQSGVVSTIEQVLQLINNQTQSSLEVLIDLKDEFVRNARTPMTIDLEKGKNMHGKTFTRLCFLMVNDWSNDSGATRLVISSDSNTYATHTESWNSTPVYLSPDDVISSLKECTPKRIRDFNKPKQFLFKSKLAKPPRHFKASGF